MELQEFITQTLVDIASGVKGAQEQVGELGGKINPDSVVGDGVTRQFNSKQSVIFIDMNIALSVEEQTKKGSAIGVISGALSLGATKGKSDIHSNVTSIKFSVPMILPRH